MRSSAICTIGSKPSRRAHCAYRVHDDELTLRFGGAGELRLVRADTPPQ